MTETPCRCDSVDEMQLKRSKTALVASIVDVVSCDSCRVIIETLWRTKKPKDDYKRASN